MNSKTDSANHNDVVVKPNDCKMTASNDANQVNVKTNIGTDDKSSISSAENTASSNNSSAVAIKTATESKDTLDKITTPFSNNTSNKLNSANSTYAKGAQSNNAEKATDSDSLINPSVSKVSSTGDNSSSLTAPKNHSNYGGFNSHRGPRRPGGQVNDFHANSDRHMGSNSENLSKTNLYIRGLSSNTTDQDLYNMCAKFGNIVSTKAIQDKTSGSCRGYGFVLFSSPQSAQAAVKELSETGVQAQMARVPTHHEPPTKHHPYQSSNNNSQYHHHQYPNNNHQHQNHHGNGNFNPVNSNMMNNHAQNHGTNHGNVADPTNLYLANLPPSMGEVELEALLSNYGPVVSTRILRDESNNPRGVGFARMESKDKCQEIIDKLNGEPYKGSKEPLLVKFADGGNRKRHHNNHNHQHHHHLNNSHHKHGHEDGRWRENADVVEQNISQTTYEHQRNLPHSNHLSDMSMIGPMSYSRMPPAFNPAMAANAPYPSAIGPSTSAAQWIHPGSGQAWNVIPQIIQPNSLGPSSQGAIPANYPYGHISQLTNQMQGLQITHHSGPGMSGFVPQWSPVWSHHMSPHQQPPTQTVRSTAPIQSSTTSQQQIPQVLTGATLTFTEVQDAPQNVPSKKPNLSDTDKQINVTQ